MLSTYKSVYSSVDPPDVQNLCTVDPVAESVESELSSGEAPSTPSMEWEEEFRPTIAMPGQNTNEQCHGSVRVDETSVLTLKEELENAVDTMDGAESSHSNGNQ